MSDSEKNKGPRKPGKKSATDGSEAGKFSWTRKSSGKEDKPARKPSGKPAAKSAPKGNRTSKKDGDESKGSHPFQKFVDKGPGRPSRSRDDEGDERPRPRRGAGRNEAQSRDERPFKRSTPGQRYTPNKRPRPGDDEERTDRKPYGKPANDRFDRKPGRKPFDKGEEGRFDRKPGRKPFDKDDDRKPGRKPFGKKPFDRDEERPRRRKRDEDLGNDTPNRHYNPSDPDNPKKKGKSVPRRRITKPEPEMPTPDSIGDEGMRLNKFLAHAGIASRRKADKYIAAGLVTVNGETVLEMGYKVKEGDKVTFKGKRIDREKRFVYVLLNKPKDFITTTSDERDRNTVMTLVQNASEERIYPVGRLDRNTTGLLLFTNDGELAQKLTHPSHGVKKIYHVVLNKPMTLEEMEQIARGLELEDGVAMVDNIAFTDEKDKTQIGVDIHIGKNRIVRRIFEHLGYDVVKLDRVYFGGLTKKDLPRGKWRFLTEKEVIMLKHFV